MARIFVAWPGGTAIALALGTALAPAAAAPTVTVSNVTGSSLVLDASQPCSVGPRQAVLAFRVTNSSGAAQAGLSATLSGFASGIALAGGDSATRYIGRLEPAASTTLFYLLGYPCTIGVSATLSLAVTDDSPGATNGSALVTTVAATSQTAGGMLSSASPGAGTALGQTLVYDVSHDMPGTGSGTTLVFGVGGGSRFAECFRLESTQVVSSGLAAVPTGTSDGLEFTAATAQSGSVHDVSIRYRYRPLCTAVSGQPRPYSHVRAASRSYSGNHSTFIASNLPAATMPLTISRSVTPQAPAPGGTAVHAITVSNASGFDATLDSLSETVPTGASFAGLAAGAACGTAEAFVDAGNTGSAPPGNGATGTLTFRSNGPQGPRYTVPAGGRLTLCYMVNYGGSGPYEHSATGAVGQVSLGIAAAAIELGTPQMISFGANPGPLVFGGGGAGVVAIASSGLAVTYGSATPALCTVTAGSGVLTLHAAGECIVTADQPGDAQHAPAPQATQTVVIERAPQVIGFDAPAARPFGDPPFAVSASGGGSGVPVVFSSNSPEVCDSGGTNGATISLLGAGTCTLRASQAGSDNYLPAADVVHSFDVAPATVSASLQATPDPARVRSPVRLVAALDYPTATGTVAFLHGGATIAGCSARSVTSAQAECDVPSLPIGSRTLLASYSGDANHAPAVSEALTLEVTNTAPDVLGPGDVQRLEDLPGAPLVIVVGDAETPVPELQLSAHSDNPALIDDDALAEGLSGSGAERSLLLATAADRSGVATITLTLADGDGGSATSAFVLTVLPVNDPPTLSLAGHRFHPAGTDGVQTVTGFATASPGPADESAQALLFDIDRLRDPGGVVDTITLGNDGALQYTLTGASGAARFVVQARDDGGSDNGGNDTSAPAEFVIAVGDVSALSLRIRRVHPLHARLAEAVADGATVASYAIDVANDGPATATSVHLRARAHGLQAVVWECQGPAAGCDPAAGIGAAATVFDLAGGATATIELSGEIDGGSRFVQLLASAAMVDSPTLQARKVEPTTADAVFIGGFE
jgi:hypothetical protein